MSKYNVGQIVYSLENPNQKLIVRRFLDRIYYCRVFEAEDTRELVFFERELASTTTYSLIPRDDNNQEILDYHFWN